MGFGSYSGADWAKLKSSSKISDSSTASQIFKAGKMEERFDPKFINKRESRDSEDHPNSTPVIIGLDVTGSMGYLSAEIAKNGLNETMLKIYSTKPIEDPQMMFAAIGDATSDKAPLQVTQFESDIRIAEQLMSLWLEGCGGDGPEDYPLLWYFAANNTDTDAYKLHGKKGFLFTIGDCDCHEEISGRGLDKVFGGKGHQTTSVKKMASMAGEKYELFHINLNSASRPILQEAIPGRVLNLPSEHVSAIPEVIISVMQLSNGMDRKEILAQWSELVRPVVSDAISQLVIGKKMGIHF